MINLGGQWDHRAGESSNGSDRNGQTTWPFHTLIWHQSGSLCPSGSLSSKYTAYREKRAHVPSVYIIDLFYLLRKSVHLLKKSFMSCLGQDSGSKRAGAQFGLMSELVSPGSSGTSSQACCLPKSAAMTGGSSCVHILAASPARPQEQAL